MSFLKPSLLKEASGISVSMSSLIDFDGEEQPPFQSRPEPQLPLTQPQFNSEPEIKQQEAEPEDRNPRKSSLDTAASRLRARLQLALFKVQSNQITTPFSRLAPPSKSKSPSPLAKAYLSSPMSSPPAALRSASRYVNSPESRIAIARAKAAMQRKPSMKPLEAIAMPNIRPTAFSARWQQATPVKAMHGPEGPGLTSSVVRGEAASCLMSLRGAGEVDDSMEQ